MNAMLPYPGLRPFSSEETPIFFGREEHVDQLLLRLEKTRFLSIIGPSGCGKSSLIRAGLIPALHSGFMSSAGVSWSVSTMRPGANPLKSLASALLQSIIPDSYKDANAEAFIYSMLNRGPLGLVEVLQENRFQNKRNLLLLVDQFEELFRISTKTNPDEADEFISLLLYSASQSDIPVYIVITMRTDYLGECASFQGLPEVINMGQYLTPRLTRDQRKCAITGPAAVFGGEIDPKLVNQLLNDMGNDSDQLPLMQHVLRRMWITASKKSTDDLIHLSFSDYEKAGCLNNALSIHAEEIVSQLNPEQAHMAEVMFRNLCELDCGSDNRYVRRPLSLEKICEISGIHKRSIEIVINHFRHYDCSFLTPHTNEPLTDSSIIDISHESLIRQWPRLKEWVDKEAKSSEIYKLLLQNASLWEKNQGALYGTPNLEIALNKKAEEQWSSQWAERYGGKFELSEHFLEKSIEARKEEEEKKRQKQKELEQAKALAEEERKQAVIGRNLAIIGWGALVSTAIVIMFLYFAFVFESGGYYNSWVKRFGLPVGIGKLSKKQVQLRSESYKIIKKGFLGPVVRLEVRDSKSKLKESESISTYLQNYSRQTERISVLMFTSDNGKIVSEMAYNCRKQLIWGFVYFPISPVGDVKKQVIASYIGKEGLPKTIGKSTATSVRFSYSAKGNENKIEYLDSRGNPQPGVYGSYGLQCRYDQKGKCTEFASIDAKGKLMNDQRGYCLCQLKYNRNGNVLEITMFDVDRNPTLCNEGYFKWKAKYDNSGNEIEERVFNTLNKPTYNKYGYHICRKVLGQKGLITKKLFFGSDEKPVFVKGGFHENRISYDKNGNMIELAYFGFNGQAILCKDNYHKTKILYDTLGQPLQWNYFGLTGEPCEFGDYYHCCRFAYDDKGDLVKVSYYDLYSNTTRAEDNWAAKVMLYDNRHNLIRIKYLDQNGKPILTNDGYHIVQYDRDDRGNPVREQYFSSENRFEPINCKDGYQTKVSEYDDRGYVKTFSFFDSHGDKAIDSVYGCHLVDLSCDEKGNDTLLTYWGTDDKLVMAKGVNKVRIKYDERNNRICKQFFDIQDIPVNISLGYHKEEAEWDIFQNRIEWKYFDINGKRVNGKEGYHRKHCDYDEIGNMISIAYFDSSNQQFIAPHGYHSQKFTYNRFGQVQSYSYYGPQSKPLAPDGFHKVIKEYNNRGQIASVSYLDTLLKHSLCKEGYHKIQYGYNQHGFFGWVSYHGINEENIMHRTSDAIESDSVTFHKKVVTVDGKGNWTSVCYFGKELQPINIEDGYHKIVFTYDSLDYENSRSYFGNDGRPILHPGKNYHKLITTHDSHGNILSYSKFGIDGLPVSVDGHHKLCFQYDSLGYVISKYWFGTSGAPIELDGVHRQSATYDKNGNMTSLCFFDKKSNPAMYFGYHKTRMWYDTLNRLVVTEFYGLSDEPINNNNGYFRWITKYRSLKTTERLDYYFDRNCRPVIVETNHNKR